MNKDIFAGSDEFISEKKSFRAIKTILCGGLVVGVLDGLFALIFYGMILGVPNLRIFQSVASGLLGKSAFEGGTQSFLIGIFLHFLVATCITSVYYLASLKLPLLIRRPVICGLIYGLLAYLGMNYVVIPLSNATPGKFSAVNFTVAIIGHAFLVGLPIALITKYFAEPADNKTNS